jgi:hypothetical protein
MIINKKTSYRLLSYGLVVKEEIIKVKAESSKLQPLWKMRLEASAWGSAVTGAPKVVHLCVFLNSCLGWVPLLGSTSNSAPIFCDVNKFRSDL